MKAAKPRRAACCVNTSLEAQGTVAEGGYKIRTPLQVTVLPLEDQISMHCTPDFQERKLGYKCNKYHVQCIFPLAATLVAFSKWILINCEERRSSSSFLMQLALGSFPGMKGGLEIEGINK